MLKLHAKSRTPTAGSLRPLADVRQIAATDKAIDALVRVLYGLTGEEIGTWKGPR